MPDRGDFTILIADDEEGMRLGLQKALSLEGYRVVTAATAAEARENATCWPSCGPRKRPWSSSPPMRPSTRRCGP
jgi:response regulator RpfG family c-di-GMP phosphodiesterase